MKNYKENEIITGKITGINKYGIFLKIDNDFSGMVHISEISNRYIKDIRKLYVIDDEIKARIISIDYEKKQVKLCMKGIKENAQTLRVLKESGRGFSPLKENLDYWVKSKIDEIKGEEKNKQIRE